MGKLNKFLKLIRLEQWWVYKIAPAVGLYLLFRQGIEWIPFAQVVAGIFLAAMYTSLSNDFFDLDSDARAGKFNRLASFRRWPRRMLLLATVGMGAAFTLTLSTVEAQILYAALWLNWTFYSAPPVRTKERGAWGAISDASGSHLIPTLFVAALAGPLSASPVLILAVAWSLMWGIRGIVWHQLLDFAGDKASGVSTWAVRWRSEKLQRFAERRLFILEVLLFAALSAQVPNALLGLLLFALFSLALHHKKAVVLTVVKPVQGAKLALYDWYILGFPLWVAAVWAPVAIPIFALLFARHLWAFVRLLTDQIQSALLRRPKGSSEFQALQRYAKSPVTLAITHDCSRTGAPLIMLEILKEWRQSHRGSLVVLAVNGGEIESEFRAVCDDFLVVRPEMEAELAHFAASLSEARVLANSFVSRDLAAIFKSAGHPVTLLVHEFTRHESREAMKTAAEAADRIILPSSAVLADFRASLARFDLSVSSDALEILPQGVFPRFLEDPVEVPAKLEGQPFRIVGAGTKDWRKGIDLFVTTAFELLRLAPDARFEFVWFGTHSEAMPYALPYTLSMAEAFGVADRVHFEEPLEDLRPELARADAFLMSSRIDPYPCVVLEAMAMGTPVVLFDKATGSTDFIEAHGGGEVVPYLATKAAAEILKNWIDNPEKAAKTGETARKAVRAHATFAPYAAAIYARTHD
jgi:glycosyltransferase involved in cell wall biosynthesis